MSRAWEIVAYAGELFFALWVDELLGRAAAMEEERAREAVEVIIKLGPTFVKIGQSLSGVSRRDHSVLQHVAVC